MRLVWPLLNISVGLLCGASALELPPNECPQYFQYVREGDKFVGKLTLPDLPKETIIVDLQLSQHEFTKDNNVGDLRLWTDILAADENLANNEPVEYRVTFPSQTELPKVTRIAVNGREIFAADRYPAPSESIALQHWFSSPNAKPSGRKIPLPKGFTLKYKFGDEQT